MNKTELTWWGVERPEQNTKEGKATRKRLGKESQELLHENYKIKDANLTEGGRPTMKIKEGTKERRKRPQETENDRKQSPK